MASLLLAQVRCTVWAIVGDDRVGGEGEGVAGDPPGPAASG
jgi:hypothetical protein